MIKSKMVGRDGRPRRMEPPVSHFAENAGIAMAAIAMIWAAMKPQDGFNQ